MQEVQRFNKVLKSFVLSGDIILLNLLLWVFGSLWGNRSPFEFSMPLFQNMALMTLCYLVCNIRSGVILHRPVVRPEQIMLRVARNMIPFVLIVLGLSYIFHFECVNLRQLGAFLCSSHYRYYFLSPDVSLYSGALSQKWGKCPKGSTGG